MKVLYFLFLQLLLSTIIAPTNAQTSEGSVFGRYLGVLEHERTGEQQLAKLDFILDRNEGSTLALKAILTLHFGDYTSQEYAAFHFNQVQFNLLTSSLVFDQPDQDVRVVVERFEGGVLSGTLKSNIFGTVGKIKLQRDEGQSAVLSSLPLIEPVQGEYKGKCNNKESWLRLFTYRATEDITKTGNPFGAYEIVGHIAQYDFALCGPDPERPCVLAEYNAGSYDYFSQELKLIGRLSRLKCKKIGSQLNCDSCQFQRVSNENELKNLHPPTSVPELFVLSSDSSPHPSQPMSISGEYEGYLYHEYLNTYQKARIDLSTFQTIENGESHFKVSAAARLIFGNGNKEAEEILSYRFDNVDYPNPTRPFQLVFARSSADVDAIIRISSFKDGVIKGEWFSLMFGRVGAFELRKKELEQLPTPKQLMTGLTGEYKNSTWFISLAARLGRTPINTDNPFFPLQLEGFVGPNNRFFRKDDIQRGSYDFYTGKFALLYDNNYLLTGTRFQDGNFSLSYVANKFAVLAQNFYPDLYKKINE